MKKIIKLALLSILAVSLAACGGSKISKNDFIDDYKEAFAKSSTMTDLGMDMEINMSMDGETLDMSTTMDIFNADIDNLKEVEMYVNMSMLGQDIKVYFVDNTMFMEQSGQKVQMPLTEDYLDLMLDQNAFGTYINDPEDVLESFDFVSGEKVDGGTEYKLKPKKEFFDKTLDNSGLDGADIDKIDMTFVYFISDAKELEYMNGEGTVTSSDGKELTMTMNVKLRSPQKPEFDAKDYQKVE